MISLLDELFLPHFRRLGVGIRAEVPQYHQRFVLRRILDGDALHGDFMGENTGRYTSFGSNPWRRPSGMCSACHEASPKTSVTSRPEHVKKCQATDYHGFARVKREDLSVLIRVNPWLRPIFSQVPVPAFPRRDKLSSAGLGAST